VGSGLIHGWHVHRLKNLSNSDTVRLYLYRLRHCGRWVVAWVHRGWHPLPQEPEQPADNREDWYPLAVLLLVAGLGPSCWHVHGAQEPEQLQGQSVATGTFTGRVSPGR
jgi:hypothetical protein